MNLPELSIRRPVMTTLLMIGLLLFGIMGYRLLPVSDLPNVDFPTIMVRASLPGASPETMASAVATPLERQFSTIAGLDSMSSSSVLGTTQIVLQFNLERNIDAAAQDVQAAITAASRRLPADMPSPPTYQKVNPADQPILYIALTAPTLPLWQLDEYGETLMAQRISTVSGVSQVQVHGAQKYAVRIQINPEVLASINLSSEDIAAAVQNNNVNLPTGVLYGPYRAFTVEATGQMERASEFMPLIVTFRNGSPIRLQDIAKVYDSVENDKTAAWYVDNKGSMRSIVLAVQRQPGTNTVAVANAVKALLPSFRAQLPGSVEMHIIYDRSIPIKDSAHDVQFTLLLTLVLVIMVIFLFLRNLSATIIPSLTLPMSIVGTFAFMYVLGYSLDNLSLMALTLSVGFVVDDAIVMLENIFRHGEMGKNPYQAALDGSREIGFTIISMTLSLAAVFLPVILMGGLVGRLFREFGVTIGIAVLISGFVSLTLTPMMASRFIRRHGEVKHGRVFNWSERVFQAALNLYDKSLNFVVRHKRTTVLISLAVLAGTFVLFVIIPKGFLPSEDRNLIFGSTEAAEGISYRSLFEHQRALAEIVRRDDRVESFMSSAGGMGGGGNTGILLIRLVPKSQRDLNADQMVQVLRAKLSAVPGIRVFLQNPPVIPVGGRMTSSQYQFTLQGLDTDELYAATLSLQRQLELLPILQDVTSDLKIRNPQVTVDIDRDKARALGVSAGDIENALYNAYGSREISTILTPTNEYEVILESLWEYQLAPSALSSIYVRSVPASGEAGRLVPLSAISKATEGFGPLSVNHSGQLPAVTISFNLRPGASLGEAVAEVTKLARYLPAGVSTSFQGTAQAFQSSQAGMITLVILAIVVIYMVLGILYESFIHPITILTALPFAGFGALATLLLFHTELSLYAFVGIIMLVGIVKKNGIMMIDFALAAQAKEGKTPQEAILQACKIRFRPIMMTTFAALMAGLPLAIGFGTGAESRRPLGLAIVGGLVFSQTLTLFVTPVFYLYMERLRHWLGRWSPKKA
jgi:HAE1 family hydrophobic/amphiphilic exporter-1